MKSLIDAAANTEKVRSCAGAIGMALTATAKPDALNYIAFMRSNAAKMIFEKYGFTFLIKPTS